MSVISRYVLYQDGNRIAHSFDINKLYKLKGKIEYECLKQDIPYLPKFEIQLETIRS